MRDRDCVSFLQWALPRMGMRWRGFRRVRRQVCRRIARRLGELELRSLDGYRSHLELHPEEWETLAYLCRITISRFNRDREVFRVLGEEVLPDLAAEGAGPIRAWSAGCASGEEPYSLMLHWRLGAAPRFPDRRLEILATNVDPHLLERARRAEYPEGALRDLEPEWIARAFEETAGGDGRDRGEEARTFRLREELRAGVRFRLQDVRREVPDGPFHLILCRNLVFTYFDEDVQKELLHRILARLPAGGFLVLGGHESLPSGQWPLAPHFPSLPVFRRI